MGCGVRHPQGLGIKAVVESYGVSMLSEPFFKAKSLFIFNFSLPFSLAFFRSGKCVSVTLHPSLTAGDAMKQVARETGSNNLQVEV